MVIHDKVYDCTSTFSRPSDTNSIQPNTLNPSYHYSIISQLTNSRSPGFVDEHPGGEEVLLDVGGQDSTEAFEDVGHSDEAREILEGLLVGTLKRGVRVQSHPTLCA